MSRRCDAHGMKLDLFCLGHNTTVCARCAQDDYFKCPKFVPIEDTKKYLSSSLQDGSREQQSTKETVVLIDEENTFTKYVKMAVEITGARCVRKKIILYNTTRGRTHLLPFF
jgi:phage terminase large subunit-like protein